LHLAKIVVTNVPALDHVNLVGPGASIPLGARKLGHWGSPPPLGHHAPPESKGLDIPEVHCISLASSLSSKGEEKQAQTAEDLEG